MDDSDGSQYHPDESDVATPSLRESQPRPETPEPKNDSESVATDPPSTLRRSTRQPMPVRRLETTVVAREASSQLPRGAPGPRHGSHDHTVQMLLKLPGFCFTRTNNVFSARDGGHLATILGAQCARGGTHRLFPASNQQMVCVRVADVIEACCDEWLDEWQDEALTGDFWVEAAERLRISNRYWAATNPTPVQVNTVCLVYIGHWDEKGRGDAADDESSWGFELGDLTWGEAKADIDPDLFAKPWEYERALRADEWTYAENAARDFFEYISETETNFGPIQNAVGTKAADRNKATNRGGGGGGRSLVAPTEAPEGSRPRAVAMNEAHQFIFKDKGDPVIVYGPRHSKEQGEGSFAGRVQATIDRSDPNRLLVTFSGLVFKPKQEAQQGDEGKDF